jgi:hypothetical protein
MLYLFNINFKLNPNIIIIFFEYTLNTRIEMFLQYLPL